MVKKITDKKISEASTTEADAHVIIRNLIEDGSIFYLSDANSCTPLIVEGENAIEQIRKLGVSVRLLPDNRTMVNLASLSSKLGNETLFNEEMKNVPTREKHVKSDSGKGNFLGK